MTTKTVDLDNVARPRIVRLGDKMVAVAFDLMKLLPALFMLRKALDAGDIQPGGEVVETTSGTFGLGLARACRILGLRLFLCTDPAVDDRLRERLEELGAEVHIVDVLPSDPRVQTLRMEVLKERLAQEETAWWPKQYANYDNPASYASVAGQLIREAGLPDVLVCAVGSGGSSRGIIEPLRALLPETRLIGVDTFGSVLFGLEQGPRSLRGLGNSLKPKNVVHELFDEVHWVDAAVGFSATRRMHRETTLYQGPTSGAAWWVAQNVAKRMPEARIAIVMPDGGERYASTVHSREWMEAEDFLLDDLPFEPTWVSTPQEAQLRWSAIQWGRRSLDDVMNGVTR